jgi:hypothetical protein|tara:strand:- start:1040 stop:1180 length:141 start_codon:yes stop_codon:yes gene_type:complete
VRIRWRVDAPGPADRDRLAIGIGTTVDVAILSDQVTIGLGLDWMIQ